MTETNFERLKLKYGPAINNSEVNAIAYWNPPKLGENNSIKTEEDYIANAKKQINSGLGKKLTSVLKQI